MNARYKADIWIYSDPKSADARQSFSFSHGSGFSHGILAFGFTSRQINCFDIRQHFG